MIQFTCEHCGQHLRVADACAGRPGRCPRCRQAVTVPSADAAPPPSSQPSRRSEAPPKQPPRDDDLLELRRVPVRAGPPETAAVLSRTDGPDSAETTETASEIPPRLIDVFAYPANLDGLAQIAVLALGVWLSSYLGNLLGGLVPGYGALLGLAMQLIVAGYVVFYLGYCIYDSSQGGRRAATISLAHTPGLSDVLGQLLLLLGGIAVCFWPAGLYRGVTERSDVWFWILAATGAFFLPMSLLTATLFEGFDALNPLLIVRSILATLPAYLALIVTLGVPGGIFLALYLTLARVPVARVLAPAAYLYLMLVGAHLLGRFYRRHKDRLEWGL